MALYTSSLTCTVDGLAHLVSDDAAAEGVIARRGTYAALCGHMVHVAALVSSTGRPCQLCNQQVQSGGAAARVEPQRRRLGRFAGRGEHRKAIR